MKVTILGVAALAAALAAALPAVGAPSPLAEAAALVTGRQIANSSITGKDVRNRSLTSRDFRGSVRGPRGVTGPAGPAGPAGPVNLGRIARVTNTKTILPGDVDHVTVTCPAGYGIVSGGNAVISVYAYMFYEDGSRSSWSVGVDNYNGPTGAEATAIAFCAPTSGAITTARVATALHERVASAEARQRAVHR
jgi:hypothetical protein